MARIVMQPSGKTVDCAYGDTVLMALERPATPCPTTAAPGLAANARSRSPPVSSTRAWSSTWPLSQDERKQGYGLMCMAKPISEELVIEWGTEDAKPKLFPPREDALFVVTDKRPIADRVMELRLRPVGQPIRYWPGQYVTVGNPGRHSGAGLFHFQRPRPDGELVLQVARADGGTTSNWIHDQLAIGESVKISGAYGTFIGDPSVDTPVLCLAAGTGLAPILSLAEAALRRGFRKPSPSSFRPAPRPTSIARA